MQKEADFIIIGAGILGSSLAYYLSLKGKKVIVLEKTEISSGVSSTTAALVLPSPKVPKGYNQLAWKGYERFKELNEKFDGGFELQITGSVMLCRNRNNMDSMKQTIEINEENGKNVRWLSVEEICELEPILNPEAFCGGTYCEEGGNLNPFLLVNSFIQAAKRMGAEVYTFTEVTGFVTKNCQVTEVQTNRGNYKGKQVVSAAGNGTIEIGRMLGFNAHIKNTRGLIIVSEKMPKLLHATYAEMRQTEAGNILMGANFRELHTGETDNRVYYDELKEVCNDIGFLAPELKKLKIIRTYSGIRVLPEDGLPIVGRPAGYKNFWVYEMHSAFSASPELSWRLAGILCNDENEDCIKEFQYKRFEN